MTVSVTAEFREEFEAERSAWLRRRFLWYTGLAGGFLILTSLISSVVAVLLYLGVDLTASQPPPEAAVPATISTAFSWVSAMLFVSAFARVRRVSLPSRESLLRIITWVIVLAGVVKAGQIPFNRQVEVLINPQAQDMGAGSEWMFSVAVLHLVASLFIPWTPREALKPIIPLFIVGSVIVLLQSEPWWLKVVILTVTPLIGAPGLLIAGLRQNRFRSRFFFRALRSRYGEMKRELVDAQRIHEDLFPEPVREGPFRVEYCYEPMRQIGGDYLFMREAVLEEGAKPVLDVVLVDVTGHGISAALAVNRLHGEITREYGADPKASPGDLLKGLNAYLNYSLAVHSVYATAACFRFDPNAGTVRWANAGHPPAFLRTADGRIDRLPSTTFLLGVCRADDFIPNEQEMQFVPGDVLISYTDGATEAVGRDGRMLRVDGIQKLVASVDAKAGAWAKSMFETIADFRDGAGKDDMLIVEVARPVGSQRSETTSPAQTTTSTGSPPNS
ncbi:MAG: PP2C family protein-serine/threonine phosphatase [Planctomycetota bacterium]